MQVYCFLSGKTRTKLPFEDTILLFAKKVGKAGVKLQVLERI